MSGMEEHYRRWQDPDLVERFASKGVEEFFQTETRFLEGHGGEISSVLDIGCASGRMLELLTRYTAQQDYTGVDIIPENIERARQLYPAAEFHLGNALDFYPGRRYDLVNATGVCQHEPRFEALIGHMLSLSDRYIMFDVKLAPVGKHVVDMNRSFCAVGENRLYFVLLAWRPFLDFLRGLPDVAEIDVFGYETPPSRATRLPSGVERIVSAGVYLVRGKAARPEIRVELPEWILNAGQPV